jgi:hypothetical protein
METQHHYYTGQLTVGRNFNFNFNFNRNVVSAEDNVLTLVVPTVTMATGVLLRGFSRSCEVLMCYSDMEQAERLAFL